MIVRIPTRAHPVKLAQPGISPKRPGSVVKSHSVENKKKKTDSYQINPLESHTL
jgi:hypothetical protein